MIPLDPGSSLRQPPSPSDVRLGELVSLRPPPALPRAINLKSFVALAHGCVCSSELLNIFNAFSSL